jgi:hypothetical protein
MPRRLLAMTHIQPDGLLSQRKFAKAGSCDRHHSRKSLINGMVNNDRHPTSPRLPVPTLPQACPPALGAFYRGSGWRLPACWVFVPRATAANAAAAPQGMCTALKRGHNKVSSLYVAARSGMLRVGNKVSSFYGTQAYQRGVGRLGDVGGDALDLVKNSAGTLRIPVPISPPKMDGIEPFVRWGGGEARGVLPCMG